MKKSNALIAIDLGNTRLKAALFENGTWVDGMALPLSEREEIVEKLTLWRCQLSAARVLGIQSGPHLPWLESTLPIHWVTAADPLPLKVAYETPETLGPDRLLLASAAYLEYQTDLLVVTMGTCITYNVVVGGAFLGGAISPGWDMRYRAMNEFTAALPRERQQDGTALLGIDTSGSLRAGVDIALPLVVQGMVEAYRQKFDLQSVLFCGGDAEALAKHVKKYIFAPLNYELYALQRLDEYFQHQATRS